MSCSTSSITLLEQTRLSKLWSRWATAEWDILWSVEAVHVITAVRQVTRLSFTGWTMCKQAENHEAGCSSRWSDSAVSHRDPKVGPQACCSYLFWSFRKNTLFKKKKSLLLNCTCVFSEKWASRLGSVTFQVNQCWNGCVSKCWERPSSWAVRWIAAAGRLCIFSMFRTL